MNAFQDSPVVLEHLLDNRSGPLLVAFIKGFLSEQAQLKILAEIDAVFSSRLQLLLVHGDDFDSFAVRFGITGSPVYLFFVNGKEVDRYLGTASFFELHDFINHNLAGNEGYKGA